MTNEEMAELLADTIQKIANAAEDRGWYKLCNPKDDPENHIYHLDDAPQAFKDWARTSRGLELYLIRGDHGEI